MKSIIITFLTTLTALIFADCLIANTELNQMPFEIKSKGIFFPKPYSIKDWHCIKNSPVICIAIGSEGVDETEIPALLTSIDGGKTWKRKLIIGSPTPGALLKISCAWDGSMCAATGRTAGDVSFVVQSTDLIAWRVAKIPSTPPLDFVACTGDIQGPLCIATGTAYDKGAAIIQTRNRGASWELAVNYSMFIWNHPSISCAGNRNTARCIVYLNYDNMNSPKTLYYFTYDGGNSWDRRYL